MNNKGNLTDERPPLLPVIIGTGFGSGFWPWGPGTAGSVLATLIWTALAYGLGITGESLQSITFFLVIVSTILGTSATAQLQPYWGELFDMMDGRLARMSGKSSLFGALWDSTLDRYSEL